MVGNPRLFSVVVPGTGRGRRKMFSRATPAALAASSAVSRSGIHVISAFVPEDTS